MTNPQAIATLRDIHLPPLTSWWPPAPGWWLLAALILLVVAKLASVIIQRRRAAAAKKEGLILLSACRKVYETTGDKAQAASEISEILRRVALVYFPRDQVAGLQGDDWVNFLTRTGRKSDFLTIKDCLLQLPYQKNDTNTLVEPLFYCAQEWIKQRGKPCLN